MKLGNFEGEGIQIEQFFFHGKKRIQIEVEYTSFGVNNSPAKPKSKIGGSFARTLDISMDIQDAAQANNLTGKVMKRLYYEKRQ